VSNRSKAKNISGYDPSVLVDRRPQDVDAVTVDLTDALPLDLVVNEHESPALTVAAAWRTDRRVKDALLHLLRDRFIGDPTHGTGRVQGFANVHSPGS
jgi:hypothetical protein